MTTEPVATNPEPPNAESGEDDDDGGGLKLHVSLDQKVEIAQQAAQRIFELIGVGVPRIEVVVEDEQIVIRLRELAAGLQAGSDTRILESIQFILNKAVNKLALKRSRLSLDAEGFRRRRPDNFDRIAQTLADKVLALGKAVAIGPLGQADLRLLGHQLDHIAGIAVRADGPHDRRRLVVSPAARPDDAAPNGGDHGAGDGQGGRDQGYPPRDGGQNRRRRRR